MRMKRTKDPRRAFCSFHPGERGMQKAKPPLQHKNVCGKGDL
jgi:hypothetical protein